MQDRLPKHEIVVLGAGHTNSHVLRMWKMKRQADPLLRNARLTCVSNFPVATYSGMLPGVLAGQYPVERMEIDLARLCVSVGARLVLDEVTGLSVDEQQIEFANRTPLPFDCLSIGIGSQPDRTALADDNGSVTPIKPMQTLLARLEARIRETRRESERLRFAVVGGGAGGIEISFCLPERLRSLLKGDEFDLALINAHEDVAPGLTKRTSEIVKRELQARNVELVLGQRVVKAADGQLQFTDGSTRTFDVVLWATSAVPPPLLGKLDLPKDERGFLLTDHTLRSVCKAPIFVVGDSGSIEGSDVPKAGVYAVRQGPILWRNLPHATLANEPLERYEPQRGFLKLLNMGDGRAIGEYGGLTFRNRTMWKLKDAIDGRFMDKYQAYEPMKMKPSPEDEEETMRCVGCGGKVGASVLDRALRRLRVDSSNQVELGLDQPDDVALVRFSDAGVVGATVDFFAAPLDDAYLVGRLAALNSASDVFASGGSPKFALASACLPLGTPRRQEQLMYEVLAGGVEELNRMGAALVGGHTIEGPRLTIGYTLLADYPDGPPRPKSGLRQGDVLVLTKPIGSGVLLAAHMQARCKGPWFAQLLTAMLQSNQQAAELYDEFDVRGVTDITGFGLAGHLLEMLNASQVAAELRLADLPLLEGAEELLAEGLESTMAPANRAAESMIRCSEQIHSSPRFGALFDPQTSGGLLMGVAEHRLAALLDRLRELSYSASVLGQVTARQDDDRVLEVK